MPGSAVVTAAEQMRSGWLSLQDDTRRAWQRFHDADNLHEVAERFTSLSQHRLLSFAQPMLLRGQRLERLTAGALLEHADFALIGDKDVDPYRIWRLMPLTPPAKAVLSAVRSDLDLLRLKCEELGIDLRRQLGERDGPIPRRTTLFFGLRVDSGAAPCLRRQALKKGDLDTLAEVHFQQPANVGRHVFVNELILSGTALQAVVAGTNHAHVGAEPFADSSALAPRIAYKMLSTGLIQAIGVLGDNTVAGPFSAPHQCRLTRARAPGVLTDPYLHAQVRQDGRILPPAFDGHTLVALNLVSQVWAMLTDRARIQELGVGEATLCAAVLDGIHPFDLQDARITSPDGVHAVNQAMCLVFARHGIAGEILVPLCPRTALAVRKAGIKTIGRAEQMAAAGRWLQNTFMEIIWPVDPLDAFLAFCALCARWHRFHFEPSTLAAASRALPAAAANRESMLRLAGARRDWPLVNDDFSPVRYSTGRGRARTRSGLAELRRLLSTYRDTRARLGEEQLRARKLQKDLACINVQGDYPAVRAKEILAIECDLWLDEQHRAAKAGRQFSTLYNYISEPLGGLQLLHPCDDISEWSAPDFVEWEKDVRAHLALPAETELFGLSRFLLVGRDHLGWDVPDALLRGQSFIAKDGQRKAAAASLTFTFDYEAARPLVTDRLAAWPLIRETALLELEFRKHVSSRIGERSTLPANCMTSGSDNVVFQNRKYSNIKSPNGVRLCPVASSFAEVIRARSRSRDTSGSPRSHLFLDSSGDDWTAIDCAERVNTDAMIMVTGDPSYRPHCSRGFVACNLSWEGWETPARGLFDGSPVSAAVRWTPGIDASRIVRTALCMGVGHASTLLVYYSANWPLLRAIGVNRLLAEHEPDPEFVADALGNTQAVRAARSRAERKGEGFSAWDVIGRISVARAALPALVRKQPHPVMAPHAAQRDSATPKHTIASYFLARKTGSSREVAADRLGIPIQQAERLDEMMEDFDE